MPYGCHTLSERYFPELTRPASQDTTSRGSHHRTGYRPSRQASIVVVPLGCRYTYPGASRHSFRTPVERYHSRVCPKNDPPPATFVSAPEIACGGNFHTTIRGNVRAVFNPAGGRVGRCSYVLFGGGMTSRTCYGMVYPLTIYYDMAERTHPRWYCQKRESRCSLVFFCVCLYNTPSLGGYMRQ